MKRLLYIWKKKHLKLKKKNLKNINSYVCVYIVCIIYIQISTYKHTVWLQYSHAIFLHFHVFTIFFYYYWKKIVWSYRESVHYYQNTKKMNAKLISQTLTKLWILKNTKKKKKNAENRTKTIQISHSY